MRRKPIIGLYTRKRPRGLKGKKMKKFELKRRSTQKSNVRSKFIEEEKEGRGGGMIEKGKKWRGVRGVIRSKIRIVLERDFLIMTQSRGHWIPLKKSSYFEPPSTFWPSNTHLPWGYHRKIEIRIKYNFILLYFTISIMYNI